MGQPSVEAIETAALAAWPAAEAIKDGSWRLLATPEHPSKRINSLTCLDPNDDDDLAARIDRFLAFYGLRNQQPRLRRTPLTSLRLDGALDRLGWTRFEPCVVMTCPLAFGPLESTLPGISIDAPNWIDVFAAAGELEPRHRAGLHRVIGRVKGKLALILKHDSDGRGVATVMVVVTGELASVLEVATVKEYRRAGHGGAALDAALRWAQAAGARTAFLQVVDANSPAKSLYAKFGFRDAYPYHYRSPPG